MIIIKCKRGTGDRPAQAITDPLVSTAPMAQARGKRFLDDPDQGGYYPSRAYSFQVPYKSVAVIPGKVVTMTCSKAGLSAKKIKVGAVNLSGTTSEVWTNIDAELFE